MESIENIEKDSVKLRNGFVTIWLFLMIVGNSLSIFNLLASIGTENIFGKFSNLYLIIAVLLGIAEIIFSVLLLKWKKNGFWGFLFTGVATLTIITLNIDILGVKFSLFGLLITLARIALIYGILQLKKDSISAWENLE